MSTPIPNCLRCSGTNFQITKINLPAPSTMKDLNVFLLTYSTCGGVAGTIADDPKKVRKDNPVNV